MSEEKSLVTFSFNNKIVQRFDKFCEYRHLVKSSLVEELVENYMDKIEDKEKIQEALEKVKKS